MKLMTLTTIRHFLKFFRGKGRGVIFYPPVFLFIFLFFSCGIDTYPVLYDPIVSSLSSTSPIYFYHDARNDPDAFLSLGYDIYYRIYDNNNLDPVTFNTDIKNDASSQLSESVISSLIIRNWDQMGNYRRIYLTNSVLESSSPPVFKLSTPVSSNYSISLNFNSTTPFGSYISNDDNTDLIDFKRYLGNDTSDNPVIESFSLSDFSDDDIDVPPGASSYRVAFFALTYGFTTDLRTLHSNVVYIGSVLF